MKLTPLLTLALLVESVKIAWGSDALRKGKKNGKSNHSSDSSEEEIQCAFSLTSADGSSGSAKIEVGDSDITIMFRDANPFTLYTVWVDYRNRSTLTLASDYPVEGGTVDIANSGPGIGRGVAPLLATNAPIYEGARIDLNGVVTDENGDADLEVVLDYNLLGEGQGPVTAASLSMQGMNRVGGSWLRMYEGPVADGASKQVLGDNGVPKIVRSTPQGLTIVGHVIPVSHGHTPGVGGVDHFPGYFGDFPAEC